MSPGLVFVKNVWRKNTNINKHPFGSFSYFLLFTVLHLSIATGYIIRSALLKLAALLLNLFIYEIEGNRI